MLLNHNTEQLQIVITKANDLTNKQNSKISAEDLKKAKENDAKKLRKFQL